MLPKLQCGMRCWLRLGEPNNTDATAEINFWINTVRCSMRLVIGRATTFIREGNDHTRITNNPYHELSPYRKCWTEAQWSAFANWFIRLATANTAGDESTCGVREQRYVHPVKWWQVHLQVNQQAHQEESQGTLPVFGNDKCMQPTMEVKYTYIYSCEMRHQMTPTCLPKQFRTRYWNTGTWLPMMSRTRFSMTTEHTE